MSLKPEQIRIGTSASDNDKLIISAVKNGLNGIGQGMSSHANSQLTFAVDTTGAGAGIKLLLKDNTIKGAGNSASATSQIEANSIDTADIKADAVTTTEIADSTIVASNLNISGQAWAFAGASSVTVPAPTADTHAATKKYVDDKAQGLDFKDSVEVATLANLAATYNSAAKTLTNSGSQAALSIDGVTLAANDRVLVKNQGTPAQNGIYSVTTAGDGSTNWVLTRTSDFDTDAEITAGAYVLVTEGTSNKLNAYVLQSKNDGGDPELDGSTSTGNNGELSGDLNFVIFSGSATELTGGNGLAKAGVELSVDLTGDATALGFDGSSKLKITTNASLSQSGSSLAVALGGQTAQNTNASLQLTSAGTNGLAVKVDGSTVAVGTNGIQAAVLAKATDDQSGAQNVTGTSPGSTGIEISKLPATDCDVYVFINGVMMQVGDGTTTGAEVFFMPNGDTTISNVRAFNNLADNDELWFAPAVAGFEYISATDSVKISFMSV